MDRAALDKLYNNRAAVPTHQQDLDRWAADSERVRRLLSPRRDLAYGPHPRETLDLFVAPEPDCPLVVFIHGGYWQALSKDESGFVAEGFAAPAAGGLANVAVVNYPLAPEADMDRIVASLRRALLWLWREAAPLGIDRTRIYVSGHSAGGHLALMMILTDWFALDGAAPADLVKAGMSLSGLYDLLPIAHCYLNDKLGMDDSVAIRNSPVYILPRWSRPLPPLFVAVGEQETPAFHAQQHDCVKAYRAAGGRVTEITAPAKHHFNIVNELARPGSEIQACLAGCLR